MSKDIRIQEMWNCCYRYKHCEVTWESGETQLITPTQLKALLNEYERFLEEENLKEVLGTNNKIYATIDDRLPRFLNSLAIQSINFKDA